MGLVSEIVARNSFEEAKSAIADYPWEEVGIKNWCKIIWLVQYGIGSHSCLVILGIVWAEGFSPLLPKHAPNACAIQAIEGLTVAEGNWLNPDFNLHYGTYKCLDRLVL